MIKLPKFCTFCGQGLVTKFPGVLECPKYDQFMSFGVDTRHSVFNLSRFQETEIYDPYTGEKK